MDANEIMVRENVVMRRDGGREIVVVKTKMFLKVEQFLVKTKMPRKNLRVGI